VRTTSFGIIGNQTHNWEMKILQNKITGTQIIFSPILVVNWVWSCLFFFVSASTAATYVFTALTCTTTIISLVLALTCITTIISLRPCAYSDLIEFHYYVDTTKRGDRRWKQTQRQGENKVTFLITLIFVGFRVYGLTTKGWSPWSRNLEIIRS
jgi:hypothetical protein